VKSDSTKTGLDSFEKFQRDRVSLLGDTLIEKFFYVRNCPDLGMEICNH